MVYNSRPTKRVNALWRRRRCLACKREFTTRETINAETILRVGEPNRIKEFSRATLLLSIVKVCDHRPKLDDAYWLYDTIEQQLIRLASEQQGIISTNDIKAACLKTLKNFDTPAFVKYLAQFSDDVIDSRTLKKQLRKKA
jgi:transcriptional repressor NrdR